jgi:NADPH-dependent curcumin reductase CurA
MPESNRRFILRSRPAGRITADTFELVEEAIPKVEEGEALVRTRWISLDPTNPYVDQRDAELFATGCDR